MTHCIIMNSSIYKYIIHTCVILMILLLLLLCNKAVSLIDVISNISNESLHNLVYL